MELRYVMFVLPFTIALHFNREQNVLAFGANPFIRIPNYQNHWV